MIENHDWDLGTQSHIASDHGELAWNHLLFIVRTDHSTIETLMQNLSSLWNIEQFGTAQTLIARVVSRMQNLSQLTIHVLGKHIRE